MNSSIRSIKSSTGGMTNMAINSEYVAAWIAKNFQKAHPYTSAQLELRQDGTYGVRLIHHNSGEVVAIDVRNER